MRQIGAVRIRIAVDEDDVDLRRRVQVRERRMRCPIPAQHLLRIERDLFVQRTADAVQRGAFDGTAQRLGVDHQAAVVSNHGALDPDAPGLAIDLDFDELRDDRLIAVRVGDAAAREHVTIAALRVRPRARLPAELLGRRLQHRDRTCPLEAVVIVSGRGQHPHAELERVGVRRKRHLVDERFGRERGLRAIRIAQVAGAQRCFPDERQPHDLEQRAPVRDRIHVVRIRGAPRRRPIAALSHQLRDEHGVGLVVSEMVVVRRSRGVVEANHVALRVERAADREGERRTFRIPRLLFVAHPLHAHRTSELLRDVRRLEPRIVRGGAAVALRPFHPDDAHLLARHAEELRDAVAHAVRLHVVGIDRHLAVGRIRQRVRGTDGGMSLERNLVLGLDDLRRAGERRVDVADVDRRLARLGRRLAHVLEQAVRAREQLRCRRLLPVALQRLRRRNRLLLALAHDRDVVALAHHLHEPGHAAHGRFVHADQRRARDRRLHVARVHHPGQLHVDRPLQRAVDLGRDVVALG